MFAADIADIDADVFFDADDAADFADTPMPPLSPRLAAMPFFADFSIRHFLSFAMPLLRH